MKGTQVPFRGFRGCPPETFFLPLQEKGAEEVVGGHPQAPAKGASPLVESPVGFTLGLGPMELSNCYRKVKGTEVPFRGFQGVSP